MTSLASKRNESAWAVPAISEVISSYEIRNSGALTLDQLLERTPGFCISQKEQGPSFFLRGIRDSVLFLYDTVPLCLESNKSYNPLGYNTALSSIDHIEIIRGPGSVLWGPDAFSGIVNVVPKTGYTSKGIESGFFTMGKNHVTGAYTTVGQKYDKWASFLSIDAKKGRVDSRLCNLSALWSDGPAPIAPEKRNKAFVPDESSFVDLTLRLDHGRDFSVTARYSDSDLSYSMSDENFVHVWSETRHTPFWMLKAEGTRKPTEHDDFRFTGYLTSVGMDSRIINKDLSYHEDTIFLEGLFDHIFFNSSGIFTGGLSLRAKEISGLPVWESYLPDLLGEENITWLPIIASEDLNSSLFSVFGQYRYSLGELDLFAGMRLDRSSAYTDSLSFNAGTVWYPDPQWIFKTTIGSAYRTPFAVQLRAGNKAAPEKIISLNSQAVWKINNKDNFTITIFDNQIDHHIMENISSGAGVTTPNSQNIYGLEFSMNISALETVRLTSCLTLLGNKGADELFLNDYFSFVDLVDGKWVIKEKYSELNYEYNTDSKLFFNFNAAWKMNEKAFLFSDVSYHSSKKFYQLSSQKSISCPGAWMINAGLMLMDPFKLGIDVEMTVRNLLDKSTIIPGTYSTVKNRPLEAYVAFRKKW